LVRSEAQGWSAHWPTITERSCSATAGYPGAVEPASVVLLVLHPRHRISRSYVSRILRLTLLAPDIVERILDGRPTAGLPQLLKPFPVEWEKQRQRLCSPPFANLFSGPKHQ
jgi:hypothetical protein